MRDGCDRREHDARELLRLDLGRGELPVGALQRDERVSHDLLARRELVRCPHERVGGVAGRRRARERGGIDRPCGLLRGRDGNGSPIGAPLVALRVVGCRKHDDAALVQVGRDGDDVVRGLRRVLAGGEGRLEIDAGALAGHTVLPAAVQRAVAPAIASESRGCASAAAGARLHASAMPSPQRNARCPAIGDLMGIPLYPNQNRWLSVCSRARPARKGP